MKHIQIYVHTQNEDLKLIEVPENAFLDDLLKAVNQIECLVFLEDAEEPLSNKRLTEHGITHKAHVHISKCRRVHVEVYFNGSAAKKEFSPSAKVEHILNWALREFGLKGADAEDKVLRLGSDNGRVLSSDEHIGSFARDCKTKLYLTPMVQVQG